jgi:divalent metal cation (Fe/Co/Zn/Cd) transporter
MSEITQENLKKIQARVKALQSSRDEIIGTLKVQESKRDEAYVKLKELGIANPEKMTAKELQALADQKKNELAEKIDALNDQLAQVEKLIQQYEELQQEN